MRSSLPGALRPYTDALRLITLGHVPGDLRKISALAMKTGQHMLRFGGKSTNLAGLLRAAPLLPVSS